MDPNDLVWFWDDDKGCVYIFCQQCCLDNEDKNWDEIGLSTFFPIFCLKQSLKLLLHPSIHPSNCSSVSQASQTFFSVIFFQDSQPPIPGYMDSIRQMEESGNKSMSRSFTIMREPKRQGSSNQIQTHDPDQNPP